MSENWVSYRNALIKERFFYRIGYCYLLAFTDMNDEKLLIIPLRERVYTIAPEGVRKLLHIVVGSRYADLLPYIEAKEGRYIRFNCNVRLLPYELEDSELNAFDFPLSWPLVRTGVWDIKQPYRDESAEYFNDPL